ncbi:hypothetical protein ACQP2U_09100 [Nocardia sp. CA-084685]|uniref:hypothetical protein n=1 Tax=Nocardia sp. CA-084685 TaxID=3239970 RepID=UPI003D96A575
MTGTFLPICQDSLDDTAPAGTVPLSAQGAATPPRQKIAELLLKKYPNPARRTEK